MSNSKIVNNSLFKSSISIKGIQSSVTNFTKGIVNAKQTASKLVEQTGERIKFKQTLVGRDNQYFRRRREAVLRKQREDELEASTVGGVLKRQGTLIAKSTRGFLGRILDFIGVLLIGWLLNTLPAIIKGVQGLIKRIRTFVGVLTGFVDGIKDIFTGIGTALDNFLDRFRREDYNKPKKELQENLTKAEQGYLKLNNNLITAINPFQDPENFGIGDTFDIPEIKEENPDNKEKKEDPEDEKEPETVDEKSETVGLKIGETEKELEKTEDDVKGDAQNVAAITSPATEELTGEPLLRDLDSAAIQPENTNISFAPDVRGLDGVDLTPTEQEEQDQALEDTNFTMFNDGGKVEGKPGIDNVLAKLTSGEFIMTKETTERIGSNFFDALNKGGKIDQMISSNFNQENINEIQARLIDKTESIQRLAMERKGQTVVMMKESSIMSGTPPTPSSTKTINIPTIMDDSLKQIHHILHRYT